MKQNPSYSRHQVFYPVLLLAFALSGLPASAEFEKWTNREGKTVNMEFVRLVETNGEKAAEFKMINGKLTTVQLSKLSEADAKRITDGPKSGNAARPSESVKADSSPYDAAIQKLRTGATLTEEEKTKCSEAWEQFYQGLFKKHEVEDNTALPEAARVEFFITALKMAMIDPSGHAGWPFRSDLRRVVLSGLKKRVEETNDLFVVFCTIFPALDAGDQEYAAQSMNKLIKGDQFLAQLAGKWMTNYWIRSDEDLKKLEPFLKATGIKINQNGQKGKATPE